MAAPFLLGIACRAFFPPKFLAFLLFFWLPALGFCRGRNIFLAFFCLAWLFLGSLYAHADRFRPVSAVENFVPMRPAAPAKVFLKGRVASLPEIKVKGKKRTVAFLLDAERIGKTPLEGMVQVFLINPRSVPGAGDQVALLGKLERPRNFGAPFNYAAYLESQGIYAVFQGIGWRSLSVLTTAPHVSWLFRIQKKIAEIIDRFSKEQKAVVFKALILGTRAGLDTSLKDAFFRSGTSHLLAISGLNIALVAGSIYLMLVAVFLDRRIAACIAAIAAVFQVCIAGMGFPVLRAGWMAGVSFLAVTLERPKHSLNTFFLSLLCVLLLDTRGVENVSFQLSFLSVFSMIVFFPLWEEWRWKDLWASPLAVGLGTFPVVLWHFGGISMVSWLANFLAIPLFHFTLLGALAGLAFFWMPGAGVLFFGAASVFLKLALGWIRFCAKGRWSYLILPAPSAVQIGIYYLLLAGIIFMKQSRSKALRGGLKGSEFDAEGRLQNKGSHPA